MDPNQAKPPLSMPTGGVRQPVGAPVAGPPMADVPISQPRPVNPTPQVTNPVPTSTAAPSSSTAPQVANPTNTGHPAQSDLYAQITAEDEEIIVAPKKKSTPVVSFMAIFMKAAFWLDETRRSNERTFIFLHGIWATIMSILYLSGIITFLLSAFSFLRLPIYLEKYFSDKGIQYDSLNMADYSFSKINIVNLRGKDNSYQIPNITVHSTFADFLQNRIRMVEASDLKIDVSSGSQKTLQDFNLVIKLLQAFSEPSQTGLKLDVNTIRVSNAVLNLLGQDQKIPIPFSLSGNYMGDNQLIVKFSIDESFLKMDGSLEITGPENAKQIKIKTNAPGALTLPQRPTEKLQGELTIQKENDKIKTIQLESTLNYAYSLKTIRINLQNNGQDAFDGSMLFTVGESSDGIHSSNLSTDITLSFKELHLDSDSKITTDKPLQVNLRRLAYKDVLIEGLSTTLMGRLYCAINDAGCSYNLKEKTLLQTQNLKFNVKEEPVHFKNSSIVVLPASQENIKLQLNNPYLKMVLPIDNLKISGTIGEKAENLSLTASRLNLQMINGQKESDKTFKIVIQKADYETPNLSMYNVNAAIDNYFDPTSTIQFSAFSVNTNSHLLLKPFSLEITNVDKQTTIKAHVLTTNLYFNALGEFDPFKSTFSGRFAIPTMDLSELPYKLSEISSLFPEDISNIKGQFAAVSQDLKINGISSITGPLYISMKDVGFDWGETNISGMNGVIGFRSLEPLVTGNNQKLFIQNINSIIPISNVSIQFYINNQSIRLSSVSGQIANQDVIMSSALVSLKNPNASLPLRTAENFDLSNFDSYFHLPGVSLKSGKGSINIPINITTNGINLGELTIKMQDSSWQKENEKLDGFNLFKSLDTNFNVRSAQLILNNKKQLQLAVDGWHVPSRQKDSYGPVMIDLTEPLLKQSPLRDAPESMQKLQGKFGM